MSSRPMCNLCDEYITMGNCRCGEHWFGPVKRDQNGKWVKAEYKQAEESNDEQNRSKDCSKSVT